MDEHHIVTKKFHGGADLVHEHEWIWSAIDRTINQIVPDRLPNRTIDTLLACAARHIDEHSILFSDDFLRHSSNNIVDGLGMNRYYYVVHKYSSLGAHGTIILNNNGQN